MSQLFYFLEHKELYRKDGKLTAQPPTWEYDEDGKGAIVENTVCSQFNEMSKNLKFRTLVGAKLMKK